MAISEVYNMDNLKYMRDIPDKYFALSIVDPPYGINAPNMQMGHHPTRNGANQYPGESTAVKQKKNRLQRLNGGGGKLKNRLLNTSKIEWDDEIPTPEYFSELERISVNRIIWGGNYFPLPPTRGIVAWNKLQPWDNFSQFELAWTSFDCPAKLFTHSNTGGSNAEKKIHPTQKPIALYKYLLHHFAKEGDRIFDSHLGSGSSRIAAYSMGFDFYATERDEIYFEAQKKRFNQYKSQLYLFH